MTTIEQAINHYKYGISHDIFSEPVTNYARLAVYALERQIPKKVVREGDDDSDYVYCPRCKKCIGFNEDIWDEFYIRHWKPMHCQECGQSMIWK